MNFQFPLNLNLRRWRKYKLKFWELSSKNRHPHPIYRKTLRTQIPSHSNVSHRNNLLQSKTLKTRWRPGEEKTIHFWTLALKGIFCSKINILASFTRPHVVFILLWSAKNYIFWRIITLLIDKWSIKSIPLELKLRIKSVQFSKKYICTYIKSFSRSFYQKRTIEAIKIKINSKLSYLRMRSNSLLKRTESTTKKINSRII